MIGGSEAMEFSRAVSELARDGVRCLVVNLAGVPVMNSSGLGMLVGASASLRSAGGQLVVCDANEKILSLLKMTRLDSVLAHYATLDEALAANR